MAAGVPGVSWLLRTWRVQVAKLSQRQVAGRVFVRKNTLSMWENGHREVDFGHLKALDSAYEAEGALLDLALALGTPAGLPSSNVWVHNPQGPSSPRWAWIRPRPGAGRVDALLMWGAFAYDCSLPCDDRGVIVASPISMPNPAIWVHLRDPGWVDFGRGQIPEQLQIPVHGALSRARLAGHGHSPAGLVAPDLVARFLSQPAFAEQVLAFFGTRPDLVTQIFSTTDRYGKVLDLTAGADEPRQSTDHELFSGSEYRRLREARGLSQADVAKLATELLPDEPVSDDQIGSLERGANPRARFLRSRLDRVYRADGATCLDEVKPTNGGSPFVFDFPAYWVGPIWFIFESNDEAPALVELRWSTRYRRMQVRPGQTVTCRRPTEEPIPFIVVCPRGWRVVGGMGRHPAAHNANFGWLTTDGDDPQRYEGQEVNEIFLNWFGRTIEEWTCFTRGLPSDSASDPAQYQA
jgi:transcriptional regulator with XRE-family HTH domain